MTRALEKTMASAQLKHKSSGWTIDEIKSLRITIVHQGKFPFMGLKSIRSAFQVKCKPEESLPYAMAAAVNPSKQNRERKSKYQVHCWSQSLEEQCHFHKVNAVLIKDEGNKEATIKSVTDLPYEKRVHLIELQDGTFAVNTQDSISTESRHANTVCTQEDCLRVVPCARKDNTEAHDCTEKSDEEKYALCTRPIRYDNERQAYKQPIVVYADFEALLLEGHCETKGFGELQVPCTVSAVLLKDGVLAEKFSYTGADCADVLMTTLALWQEHYVKNEYKEVPSGDYSNSHCVICGQDMCLSDPDRLKVTCRHHCHVTGKAIGRAHNKCNSKLKFENKLNVVFHNFSKYDSKMIIRYFSDDTWQVSDTISKSTENFMSYTLSRAYKFEIENPAKGKEKWIWRNKNHIRFIDSFCFLSGGLAKLYKDDPEHGSKYLKEAFPDHIDGKIAVDFKDFTSWAMLEQPYGGFPSAREYYEYYCETDCLILAGIFEAFRNELYSKYTIDAIHCFGTPSCAWNCSLKSTGAEFVPYQSIEMYKLFKDNIRGGYTNCIRHSATDADGVIQYFDANALYAWALSQPLPTRS